MQWAWADRGPRESPLRQNSWRDDIFVGRRPLATRFFRFFHTIPGNSAGM
jgi:hypothetical protein